MSTIREVDVIFVLDRGRIVERGSHDELRAKGGLYSGCRRVPPEPASLLS
jgi:ABC-type multidrug transport system fused ATPase/permease subunit